eukprot:2141597-Amphidinium_carterae.1
MGLYNWPVDEVCLHLHNSVKTTTVYTQDRTCCRLGSFWELTQCHWLKGHLIGVLLHQLCSQDISLPQVRECTSRNTAN